MATPDFGRRIIVVGPPGSGKSTLALELSSLLRIPRLMVGGDRLLLDRHKDRTREIIIVGARPGSGERLIGELSSLLDMQRLMMGVDSLFLDRREDGMQEEIEAVLSDFTRMDEWVAEGPYSSIPRHVWDRADMVLCLDHPRLVLAWRQLRRGWSMKLIWRRRPWADLKYTFLQHAKDRDGLRRRVEAHRRTDMNVIVLNTPRRQRQFLSTLRKAPSSHS